ncbi:type II toxin-antitoxin system YoeB family toxin [Micropruina sp.]
MWGNTTSGREWTDLGNVWSRRTTQEHRLVYAVEGNQIVAFATRSHYGE